MNDVSEIETNINEIIEIRRKIHSHPETAFSEIVTANLIAEKLVTWGIEVHQGIGGTGVVGVLRGNHGTKSIGIRADMDALFLDEENSFAHQSKVPGKMHACGHDGHVAMLLAAAQVLAKNRNFYGTVNFIFQPAEEGGSGATAMINDGLFEKFPCDAVFALHNWPGIKVGEFATCQGPIMASCNEFEIIIKGKGAHAAMPHLGNDPIFAAAQIINGLQAVITRNKSPIDSAVLSITRINAGSAFNIIPDEAKLAGTVRTFSIEVLNQIEERILKIATSTAEAHECKIEFKFIRQSPATINNPEQTRFAINVMESIVGTNQVNGNISPSMGSEDFSTMLGMLPGCYAFIGNGDGAHRELGHGLGPCMLHNPSYDFNDKILPLGAIYWVKLVKEFLAK
jgi:amidohydrolase